MLIKHRVSFPLAIFVISITALTATFMLLHAINNVDPQDLTSLGAQVGES